MTLHVHTARISTRDPNRFDVTRKSGKDGLFLAPSWEILGPALLARRDGMIEAEVWRTYVNGYLAEMRLSYQRERAKWDALLGLGRVVLVCDCPSHCHRTILRERILPKLGAVDCGELPE